MHEDKEIKERILTKAEEMFIQFGYSRVKMEEIAAGLGMSKKTLYKFFPSKENIVREMFESARCCIQQYLEDLWKDDHLDFVGKLKGMMDYIGKQTSKFRGPLLEDLHKNIPEMWNEVQEFRRQHTMKKAADLIEEGVEKGIFRKDIDQQLTLLMYINSINGIINPEILSQLPCSSNQAFETIIKIMFEGILTEDGRAKYISLGIKESNKENNIEDGITR
jgi:AcrR family transcriptional regulator